MTQSVFLAPEGIQSRSSKGEVFYRVQRDAAGRVRKTISGVDTDPSKDIDLYLPQQDSLGRDTVVTRRQIGLDSAGKEKRSKDWEREYRSYDSLGRLAWYWLETDLNNPPEHLASEGCLETQFLYDARGFNHIQLHHIPRHGEVVAVSSFENNREGRPVRQRVGYIQKGKVVDWLVGNFWQYDSLGRLTYRVQYTNRKWIDAPNPVAYYFESNCNWWNRP
ncbi:MAG: hypothetical protein IPO40_09240 [Fibrobacteres bacterium]|nr:hypothetical protein [Fibrobacterota bacterium]